MPRSSSSDGVGSSGRLAHSVLGLRHPLRHGRQRGQLEIVEPHRPLAAGAGGDRELDRRDVVDLAPARRSPGERQMALLHRLGLPVVREADVAPVQPPDVGAGRVDQLELEVVHRRVGAQPVVEPVVRRQVEADVAMDDRVAATLHEREVDPQRLADRAGVARQLHRDAVGRHRLPAVDRVEAVEHASPSGPGGVGVRRSARLRGRLLAQRRRRRATALPAVRRRRHRLPRDREHQRREQRRQEHGAAAFGGRRRGHPFTLPSITPRM